jgi:hypothetical protein
MRHIYNKSNLPITLVLYSAGLNKSRDIINDKVPYIDNGQYQLIIDDINSTLHNGNPFRINIYTDASGSIFALDSNGADINNRLVVLTMYRYPFIDDIQNIFFPGYFKIVFDDGSYMENDDLHETSYWYTIIGSDSVEIKQFT